MKAADGDVVDGLRITLGHAIRSLRGKTHVTMQYPEEKWDESLPEHYRGAPALVTDEHGEAAPRLNDLEFTPEEAQRMAEFDEQMRQYNLEAVRRQMKQGTGE